MNPITRVVVAIVLVPWAVSAVQVAPGVFQGTAVERFLTEARVVDMSGLGEGITDPKRLTLALDGFTHDAVFKDIEYLRPGITQLGNGQVIFNMEDSWRFEVAAYRIDRMIGLGLVPGTVPREYDNHPGSVQWWVESEMSEVDRQRNGIRPPDPESWNHQLLKMRLFDELIYNWDRHGNNILVTADFRVRLIDHSRAFLPYDDLWAPEALTLFSRSLLDGIRTLTRENLEAEVGDMLVGSKIEAMLERRDKILGRVEARVAEVGEAVLYP